MDAQPIMQSTRERTDKGREYHVAQQHPEANDHNEGSPNKPFRTISQAAHLAEPGDTIWIHTGVYRERVSPARGGEENLPITYAAVPEERVFVKGSDEWRPSWVEVDGSVGVYRASLDGSLFGALNPYHLGYRGYNTDIVRPVDGEVLPLTRGQLFVDGAPLTQVTTMDDVLEVPSTWMVSADGDEIYVHFPVVRPNREPYERLVELTVRHRIFAPEKRNLGHIHVRGIVFEHAANNHPTPQLGAVSTRSGHHWVIEDCTIRYATTIGLDFGAEWGIEDTPENDGILGFNHREHSGGVISGHHVIRNNHITDNGLGGICGLRTWGTKIIGNVVERNNRLGFRTWEVGAIKVHLFFDGLIEGNLVRDNDCFGIWLDNQYRGSRVTRNVVLNNHMAGVMVELGLGPLLLDNNIIALTRQGDGIYAHDASGFTVAHNLIYGNANYGVYAGVATDRPSRDEKPARASNIRVLNNMILGNKVAALSLSVPYECSSNNISDSNLFMGAGEVMDESTGVVPPLFISNPSHQRVLMKEVVESFRAALDKAGVPQEDRPNLQLWEQYPFLTLDHWRAFMGYDKNSETTRLYHEMLNSRQPEFVATFEHVLWQVPCSPMEGLDYDFLGRKMPEQSLPGPFQFVRDGENRFVLWPLREKTDVVKQGPRPTGTDGPVERKDWSSNGI